MINISFIVPVYNVEQYLCKCVDSLLAQDYDNYEIIIVDDGSTDNSGSICDEYAAHSFVNSLTHSVVIKVIHQSNAGLSAARNAGIEAARGTYICFVDSDDYWEENVLDYMMAKVEREELDVLRFNYQNVRIEKGRYEVFEPNKHPHAADKFTDVVPGEQYLNERMGYACYATQFIIKRSLLVKRAGLTSERVNECLFTEGIHFEDVEWLPRMMLAVKRVNSTPIIVYNYLMRQGSISRTKGESAKMLKNLKDKLYIIEKYGELYVQHPSCNWLRKMQSSLVVGVLTSLSQKFYNQRKEYVRILQDLRVYPLLLSDQGKTYSRRAMIINAVGPSMYCTIMHFITKMRGK